MSLEDITEKIRQKLASAPGFRARIKFECGDEGVVFADTTQTPPVITHDASAAEAEADTTLSCSRDTLEALMTGKQDPNIAFMTGKLKVKGSMGVALKLNSLLED